MTRREVPLQRADLHSGCAIACLESFIWQRLYTHAIEK
jgi:hypothetical protein